jgi:uncharacterized membrane protein YphA (DoxX/SURF4 family)
MSKVSFHILRVGLAITFIWIGVLIFRTPEAWGGYLQPWAVKLLPIPLKQALIGTAFLDIAVGVLLLTNFVVWLAALAGAIHIIIVLTVSGITDITVRDIAIFAAAIALLADALPKTMIDKIMFWKKHE